MYKAANESCSKRRVISHSIDVSLTIVLRIEHSLKTQLGSGESFD